MRPPYFSANSTYEEEEQSIGFDKTIIVPYPPESKLSGVEEHEIISMIFYHREIDIPHEYAGKRILLHFGAIFYHARIFINGKLVDFHDGGSSSFTTDITKAVEPGHRHHLVVEAKSNLWDGSIPSGKQSCFCKSYKCFYSRVTGIWQTVWMEAVDLYALASVSLVPDIDEKTVVCTPTYYASKTGYMLHIEICAGDECVGEKYVPAAQGVPVTVSLSRCILWSPETPFLYDVHFTLFDEEHTVVDQVHSYIGMRKIGISNGKILLNNNPIYLRFVLDQGYYPDGQWTAPDDAALRKDIELAKSVGFNGARLHQKVFEERYLYWADTLGYLIWAESPSWGLDYNRDGLPARNFLAEWSEIVSRDKNHPCIIVWTPLNETFQFTNPLAHRRLHRDAYHICKMIDPTRPVNDSSGYIHYITDIWTVHTYEQDPEKLYKLLSLDDRKNPYRNYPAYESEYAGQPYLVDEYGGIKWDPLTQSKENLACGQNLVSWGYGESPKTLDEFYQRLEALTDVLLSLDHVCGYCYTQLTDVEQEKNGIFFYDRMSKFDRKRISVIFKKEPPGFGKVKKS